MTRRRELLSWFAVLGPPFTWAAQHVAGYALTEVACDPGGWDIPLDALTAAITAVAAVVVVLAGAAAITIFRITRDASEPPGSRVHFLSIMGMALFPLFLFIIVMSGVGSIVLADCEQG
jgi:hypothetical protein